MTLAGKTWRIGGTVLTSVLFYIALGEDLLIMAGLGFVGLVVFFVSWVVADTFDQVCCSERRPHTRQDYGEGQHWVTEDVS